MRYAIALALLAAPATAQTCPDWEPQIERQSAILGEIQAAETQREGSVISQRLWAIWLSAPDDAAQDLLDEGMARREVFDFAGAEAALTALIDYCPDYPEGWNQRAFSRFLRGDYEGALGDLDRAVELAPAHVAAISGRALTLFGLGRDAEGQAVLRDALALNPWLGERALLVPRPGEEL